MTIFCTKKSLNLLLFFNLRISWGQLSLLPPTPHPPPPRVRPCDSFVRDWVGKHASVYLRNDQLSVPFIWSSDRSFMMNPLSYFSFQPVLRDWCNKGRGMCYPVCGMMHIKEPMLLIGESSQNGGSGFLSS